MLRKKSVFLYISNVKSVQFVCAIIVAKIAEIGRAAYSKNTYFPSGGAETGTCGGRAVPPPRPPCGRSIPCAGKKANFFMQ